MKSSGFNIEDTHLRDGDRIARLFAMAYIALWAYLVGEHKDINVRPIRFLKHGRREKSLVKYRLEEFSNVLSDRPTNLNSMSSNFCHVLKEYISDYSKCNYGQTDIHNNYLVQYFGMK